MSSYEPSLTVSLIETLLAQWVVIAGWTQLELSGAWFGVAHPHRQAMLGAISPDLSKMKNTSSKAVRSVTLRLVSLLVLSALVTACSPSEPVEAEKPRPTGPGTAPDLKGTRVEVAVIKLSQDGLSLRVPGEVKGVRDALLAAPMGGYIEQVSVKEGQHVKAGALLARVDSSTYSARVVRAQVEKEAAERELERTEKLSDAIPGSELDAAKDRLANAKAQLNELQLAANRSVITAPFSGVVVKVDAEVGEVSSPGVPLFRLVKLQPILVSISLADRDLMLAQVGMSARVQLSARSGEFEGKIVQLSQAADLKTRSFEALVELPNEDESLLPGMIAQVSLATNAPNADDKGKMLVSQDWLVTRPDGVGVFLAEDGKAVWRDVKLGAVMRRQVEVVEGLKEGDVLIIVGHRSLSEGDSVLIHRRGTCCVDGRAVFAE